MGRFSQLKDDEGSTSEHHDAIELRNRNTT
jgi:hypothetical protein